MLCNTESSTLFFPVTCQFSTTSDPGSATGSDRIASMTYVHAHQAKGEVVTGLQYVDPHAQDMHEHLHTTPVPQNRLDAGQLFPGSATLEKINAALR